MDAATDAILRSLVLSGPEQDELDIHVEPVDPDGLLTEAEAIHALDRMYRSDFLDGSDVQVDAFLFAVDPRHGEGRPT